MAGLIPPQPQADQQGGQSLNLETLYQQWAQANPNVDAQMGQQAFMAGADAILQSGGGTEGVALDVAQQVPDVTQQTPDATLTDTPDGMMNQPNNWRNFKIDVSDVTPGG